MSVLGRRAASFRYAAAGVVQLVAEPNARIHLVAVVLVCAFATWLDVDREGWALLVLAMGLVLAVEALNTALESLADRVAPEEHPLVGRAKDLGAGAVLLASIAAAIVGFVVMGPPLWERLFGA